MERHDALTGFRDGEMSLFEQRLAFLARRLDPDIHEERFTRVLTIAGLPEVNAETQPGVVDAGRLVEILRSDECREFRAWLRGVDSATDAEIEERFGKLREMISTAVHSKKGKAVRLAATTGIGFVPVAGQIAGIAAGALDSLLLDKLVPEPGPTSFLSQLYPSIFRAPPDEGRSTAGP